MKKIFSIFLFIIFCYTVTVFASHVINNDKDCPNGQFVTGIHEFCVNGGCKIESLHCSAKF